MYYVISIYTKHVFLPRCLFKASLGVCSSKSSLIILAAENIFLCFYDFKVCKNSTKAWAKLPLQPMSDVLQNVTNAFVRAKKLQRCMIRHYPSWSEAIKKLKKIKKSMALTPDKHLRMFKISLRSKVYIVSLPNQICECSKWSSVRVFSEVIPN